MSDDGAIFSKEIPGVKHPKCKSADPAKPKRPYRRKTDVAPEAELVPEPDAPDPVGGQIIPIVEERFSSFGIEYIRALTCLLELLPSAQRERLVQFIIDAKIV